ERFGPEPGPARAEAQVHNELDRPVHAGGHLPTHAEPGGAPGASPRLADGHWCERACAAVVEADRLPRELVGLHLHRGAVGVEGGGDPLGERALDAQVRVVQVSMHAHRSSESIAVSRARRPSSGEVSTGTVRSAPATAAAMEACASTITSASAAAADARIAWSWPSWSPAARACAAPGTTTASIASSVPALR